MHRATVNPAGEGGREDAAPSAATRYPEIHPALHFLLSAALTKPEGPTCSLQGHTRRVQLLFLISHKGDEFCFVLMITRKGQQYVF